MSANWLVKQGVFRTIDKPSTFFNLNEIWYYLSATFSLSISRYPVLGYKVNGKRVRRTMLTFLSSVCDGVN